MPDFNQLLTELNAVNVDTLRRKYVRELHQLTGRNVIVYYSGWLQKQSEVPQKLMITDGDMNGFMSCVHGLDKAKGLDLVLHTPGGEVNATEALVNYLRSVFGTNMRAFIPQLAMSAGTMMALACREIWMGKHSSIGPIDPQVSGVPAHGIVEEWNRARDEVAKTPVLINTWEPILRKYHPTFVGQCEKAIKMAEEIVRRWLVDGAVSHHQDAVAREAAIKKVLDALGEHKRTLNHGRHVGVDDALAIGLNIKRLEEKDAANLQEALLTVHHAFTLTFYRTNAVKLIENHEGRALVIS
jgi:ATP-dependent protease ClpP protease subunit